MSPAEHTETLVPVSPENAALVEAEPLLPSLPLALDDQLLSTWLSERCGREIHARRRYLRYKPGTSVVVAAEVLSLDGPQQLLVAGYAAHAAPKLEKSSAKADPGTVVALDRDRRIIATAAEADRDLPALAATAQAPGRARVLGRLLGTVVDPASVEVTPLSYKPHRRWVGAVRTPTDTVVMRAYRPGDLAVALRPVTALHDGGAPVPPLLARSRRLGLAVLGHVSGTPLDHDSVVDDLMAAGRALAHLHLTPAALRPLDVAGGDRDTVRQVARLLPDEAGRASELDDLVTARLAHHPQRDVDAAPLHGDFSLDQVVYDGGTAGLIDLDRAHLGPRARDLGGLLADQLASAAGGWSTGRPRAVLDHVLAGYEELLAAPEGDEVLDHALDQLLARAAEPFRHARPDWPGQTRELLDAAEQLLDRGLPSATRKEESR